ncbi:hypothetical protein ASG01_07700 [Chryseobacterium sp. Leaf180]|uniref:hypothetical protein n=1 Tax=Chryseobacterium sp. Leaf180 TaxID=1736289 RepID=UPI0006F74EA9|nr:hypothetical protein [Chryseobacterium sp. Leaf180]KQR93738.1 hypothetical protein ASG01_07700 [Chryseobacterium sp. Leaf180]
MKKSLLLLCTIPFLFSCKKETVTTINNQDSVTKSEKPIARDKFDTDNVKLEDTAVSATKTEEIQMESQSGRVIMRMEKATSMPLTIKETFDKNHDKLIIKISDFTKDKISARITTDQRDFNIRFNQIKLPNGEMNGPFSRELDYQVKGKGELWLIIGKSNMADGKTEGDFTVTVQ